MPIRTDRRLRHTPWVNYGLVVINIVAFILSIPQLQRFNALMVQGVSPDAAMRDLLAVRLYLWPHDPGLVQFFSYQFLHADYMHLGMNMIFLWVFGNSVEDRFGKVGYLLFYLTGGIIAALMHMLISDSPIIGASGSIAAVTGAYLALFPLSNVTIFYWFVFMISTFEVSSMVLILFYVAQDAIFQGLGLLGSGRVGNVAYMAHLGGYAFGFAIGMGLLFARIVPREPYDLLALIEQRRRRSQFRRLTQRGFQPWESAGRPGDPPRGTAQPPPTAEQQRLMELRSRISAAIAQHDLPAAATLYSELLEADPNQVMGQQQQLDLANQLMSDGQYHTAATAYELFLQTYRAYSEKHHIQLILGLIYARYLEEPDRARKLLETATPNLDAADKELAKSVLGELGEPR